MPPITKVCVFVYGCNVNHAPSSLKAVDVVRPEPKRFSPFRRNPTLDCEEFRIRRIQASEKSRRQHTNTLLIYLIFCHDAETVLARLI